RPTRTAAAAARPGRTRRTVSITNRSAPTIAAAETALNATIIDACVANTRANAPHTRRNRGPYGARRPRQSGSTSRNSGSRGNALGEETYGFAWWNAMIRPYIEYSCTSREATRGTNTIIAWKQIADIRIARTDRWPRHAADSTMRKDTPNPPTANSPAAACACT